MIFGLIDWAGIGRFRHVRVIPTAARGELHSTLGGRRQAERVRLRLADGKTSCEVLRTRAIRAAAPARLAVVAGHGASASGRECHDRREDRVRRRITLTAAATALLAVVLLAVPLAVFAARGYVADERSNCSGPRPPRRRRRAATR